jgi:tetratricopeptide (TPR) repeat protein
MRRNLAAAFAVSLVVMGCSPQDREARYLERGQKYFDRGDYEKARLEYKNAARIAPVDPEVAYRLGLVEESLLNIGNAYGSYRHAVDLNDHFQPALLKVAQYDLAGNQLAEAQHFIDVVLSDTPDQPEARALNAALLLRKKDFENCEKEARFALSQDPSNATAYSVLTGLYLATGDTPKAIVTIAEGVTKNPGNMALLLLQARVYQDSGDYRGLDATYQQLFALKPDFVQLRIDLATIYTAAGKLDEAEKTLRDAVAAKPADIELRHQLVLFLGSHRDMDVAEQAIHEAIKIDPKNDQYYFWLADLYTAHNASDKAVALLQQIVTQKQTSQDGLNARISLARIDFVRGNKDLAQKLVDVVLAAQPANHDALYVRANLSFDRGDYENTVSDLRTVIHDNPNDISAQQLMAETLLRQGYIDLAIETLNGLATAAPADLAARVRLAQLYGLEKNYNRALDILAAIIKDDPTYAIAWESIARIATEAGDFPQAEIAIDRLAKIDGQKMTATFLQGQLAAKQGDAQNAISLYTKVIDADPTSPLAEHSMTALMQASDSAGKSGDASAYMGRLKDKSPYAETLLGESFIKQGKMDEAKAALDDAIAHNPFDQQPYLDRARLYMEDRQPDQALEILNKAQIALPADLRALMMQADIVNSLGRYEEATKLYDDIMIRSPGLDIAANNLAAMIADYQYNDPAMIEKAYNLAQKFSASNHPEFLDTLAWIEYRQGATNQALATMEHAVSLSQNLSPQMHYHYGAILMKAGKRDDAKAHLQQAVAGDVTYQGSDDAKALLATP